MEVAECALQLSSSNVKYSFMYNYTPPLFYALVSFL